MKKSFQRVIATLNLFQGKQSLTIFLFAAIFVLSACDDSSSASSDETGTSSSSVESPDSSVTLSPSTSSGQAPESAESNGSSNETKDKSSSSENKSSSSAKETKDSSDSKSSSSVKSDDSSSSQKGVSSSSVSSSSGEKDEFSRSSSSVISSDESSSSYTPFVHKSQFLTDSLKTGAYKLFKDPRDGQSYYYLTINGKRQDGTRGSVTIFAQNLNYGEQIDGTENQDDDSKPEKYCYNNEWTMCDRYGGLYQWAEAMGLRSECNTKSCANLIINPSNHQGICPNGWRLMTYDDYELIYWSTDKGAAALRSQGGFNGYNSTGLSLVGAGYRYSEGSTGFEGRLGIAAWYYPSEIDKNKNLSTSEEFDASNVLASAGYSYDNKDTYTPITARSDSKLWGLSIRCVMVE